MISSALLHRLSDGSALIVTSMDGYLTVVCFPDNDLGEPIELSKVPPIVRKLHVAHYDKVSRSKYAHVWANGEGSMTHSSYDSWFSGAQGRRG